MTDSYNPEELTPHELRQLVASNARAIEALGATVNQTNEAVTRLANLMAPYFPENQLGIDTGDSNT